MDKTTRTPRFRAWCITKTIELGNHHPSTTRWKLISKQTGFCYRVSNYKQKYPNVLWDRGNKPRDWVPIKQHPKFRYPTAQFAPPPKNAGPPIQENESLLRIKIHRKILFRINLECQEQETHSIANLDIPNLHIRQHQKIQNKPTSFV